MLMRVDFPCSFVVVSLQGTRRVLDIVQHTASLFWNCLSVTKTRFFLVWSNYTPRLTGG